MTLQSSNNQDIWIDGFNLAKEAGTGIATYARNLSFALRDLGRPVHVIYGLRGVSKEPELREVGFFDPVTTKTPLALEILQHALYLGQVPFGVSPFEIPISGRVFAAAFKSRLPHFDHIWNIPNLFDRADVFFDLFRRRLSIATGNAPAIAHWTYPMPIKIAGSKNIYTMHDLVPLRLPYTTLDVKRRYFRLMQLLAKEADHIVTVSECSRNDIINILGVPPNRVTNTYEAVDIPTEYANKPEEIVRREIEGTFNLTYKGYMLFYGAIEPKKNIGRLLEAYLGSHIDTPLVILGKKGWKSEQELRLWNDDLLRYSERVGDVTYARRRVLQVDYAPFPLLVSLIKGAKGLLFPSLYEGFGLPVLEAMTLGTPILSSTQASIPELAGEAAILVDPYDTNGMAEGIRALDENDALRAELTEKGRRRALLFSPDNYRRRLAELYRSIA